MYILLFSLFFMIKEIYLVFRQFLQPPYTEPATLFMRFPTRGLVNASKVKMVLLIFSNFTD